MKGRYVGLAMGALFIVAAVLSFPSCGHDQKLVSITVSPSGFTFLTPDPTLQVHYTATGTYIHPPTTKDITSQATWKADFAQLVTFSGPGLVSPEGDHCGGANISATAPEGTGGASNVVIGYATVTVNNPAVAVCPGGGTEATLSVQVTPSGTGTVTSLTFGIDCPSVTCIAVVPVGASIALTATPIPPHSFLNWTGCTPATTPSCTVTVPTGGVGVVATFQ
jgi:List-Bact-rpt repeat protein